MKKAIAKQWVEALRSGRYEQGRHGLRSAANNYCCLGVLCDIVAPDAWSADKIEHLDYYTHDNYSTGVLSPTFRLYTGISLERSQILAGMNDSDGASFEEIADYIAQEEGLD